MEQEHPVTESIEETQQVSEAPEQPQADNSKEMNFRAIREAKERAEYERDEYNKQNRALQEELQRAQQGASGAVEEDYGVGTDDLLDGKHYRKMMKEVESLKKQLTNVHQETSSVAIETKLKQQYSDFDTVVSAKNIKALREAHPQLAQTLLNDPDLYSKGSSAYTMIKNLGLDKKDLYDRDKALAEQNHNKPRPLSSIAPQQGDSPLSHANAFANGLTPELKNQLLHEMNEAKKNM